MNESKKKESWFSKLPFINKIKSIKHFEIVIAIILGAIALLIYFSSLSTTTTNSGTSNNNGTSIVYTNASTYASELEQKLGTIVSNIQGVGSVKVMVVLSSSSELIIAKTTEETSKQETNSQGTLVTNVTKEETPLVVSQNGKNEPLILLEILPKIAGVVVVADGASNVNTKLNILRAVQALFNVSSGNIEILEGK